MAALTPLLRLARAHPRYHRVSLPDGEARLAVSFTKPGAVVGLLF